MFPKIPSIGALNVFDLRQPSASATPQVMTNSILKQAVSATEYNTNRPRCNDTPGVVNESKLAKRLDIMS